MDASARADTALFADVAASALARAGPSCGLWPPRLVVLRVLRETAKNPFVPSCQRSLQWIQPDFHLPRRVVKFLLNVATNRRCR